MVPTFTAKGLTLAQGSLVLSIYAFVNFFSRLASGPVLQRFDARRVYSLAMLIVAGSCVTVPFISGVGAAYVFGAFFGLGYGLTVLCVQTIYLEHFGVDNFGQVSALYTTLGTFIGAALNLVPGAIYEVTGTFDSLYYLLTVCLLVGALLVTVSGRRARRAAA